MSDDSEAVIGEVSKAVRPSLDELHLTVKSLGDSIVFGKAPHAGQWLCPVAQGLCQSLKGVEAAALQPFHHPPKPGCQRATLPLGAVFVAHQDP